MAGCYEATRYIPPAILEHAARLIVIDAGLASGSALLDVGVGTGRFARYLHEVDICVIGVDISAEMLAIASTMSNPAILVRADVRALPFQSSSFDAALMVHILHLIGDWKHVVREIRRVLRPGAPLHVGSESGKRFVSRSLYFQVAAEWQLTRPNLGAESLEAILAHLAATGAEVARIDAGQLAWTARMGVGEMLESLKENPFSILWHIESFDFVEEASAALMVWRVVWP